MNQKYSPQDFLAALKKDTFKELTSIEGMAKADENNTKILLFTAAGCDTWTPIPLNLIDNITYLKSVPCKDHQHSYVRIDFKAFDSPEAKMLATLLSSHTAVTSEPDSAVYKEQSLPEFFCYKFCYQCDRSHDPDSDACQKCRRCYRERRMY